MTSASMGRYSEIGLTTVRAYLDKITTISGTTYTMEDADDYIKDSVYANGNLVLISGTAEGSILKITSSNATSNIYVVASTVAGAAVNDQVAIIPKPLAYLCLESESLKETVNWNDTECLQEWEKTSHVPLTVDTGGDLGLFIGESSPALHLVLAAAMGVSTSTTVGGGTHTMTPGETVDTLTVMIMRGNRVSLQVYGGMSVDSLTLDQPAGGMGTSRVTFTGGFGIQEIGGTSKTFTAECWNPPAQSPDPKRMHFRHCVVSKAAVPKKFVESCNVTINRNPVTDRRLGDYYTADVRSGTFRMTGTVVQWFENDDELTAWRGDTAAISDPTAFDLTYKWTGTQNTACYLEVDAYDVVWTDSSEPIAEGRIKETLTWTAKYKIAASKTAQIIYCDATTAPA